MPCNIAIPVDQISEAIGLARFTRREMLLEFLQFGRRQIEVRPPEMYICAVQM